MYMHVNLILRREKILSRENWLTFWGIWREALLILGICGERQKTFRVLRIFLGGFGEINALF